MTNRALIFAGAGASKAVNAKQFPTTVEFFERLPDVIKSNTLFQLTLSYLRQGDPDRIIDIELVLWELETLRQFSDSQAQDQSFPAYSLRGNRISIVAGGHLGVLDSTLDNVKSQCDTLIDRINAFVYQLYGHEPTKTELSSNWCNLIESLDSKEWIYDIFTTNYDISIESAINFTKPDKFDAFIGLSGGVKKWLDLNRWSNPSEEYTLYTKLHGSIDWQKGREKTLVGASNFTGNHSNHVIIYPGFKGESQSEFFAPMHAYLGNRLESANLIIFIGFAFRDEHINRLIAERVGRETRVVVINPDKTVQYPVSRHTVDYIRQGFDQDSINMALDPVVSKKRFKIVNTSNLISRLPTAP
jgi:hypothetical protein